VYLSGGGSGQQAEGTIVTRTQQPVTYDPDQVSSENEQTAKRRPVAVNEDSGPNVNTVDAGPSSASQQSGSSTGAESGGNAPSSTTSQPAAQTRQRGGWPSVSSKWNWMSESGE